MKNLIIFVLVLALVAVTFFTRPTKANFERMIREGGTVTDGQVSNEITLADKLAEQFKTFVPPAGKEATVENFLDTLQFENYYLWTNVKSAEGEPLYTGLYGYWFKRKQPEG